MTKDDKGKHGPTALTDLMTAMQEAGFKSMAGAGTNWLETLADMGSEMVNFTAARVKEDVQTQHNLMHAKGIAEAQKIQAEFFQKAMNDYAVETAKLMDMSKALDPKASENSKKSG